MGESKYGDKSKLQMYSGFLAKITSAIAVIMTYVWAKTEDTDEKFLGGLNWNDKVFNWHPILMVAGLGFAFTWGVTSFRNSLFSKPVNKTIHVLCYVLAIVCFSVGLKAVWKSHDQDSDKYIPNLYSLHSWIGLTAVVLFGQNFVLGLYHFLNPSTPVAARQSYMPSHVFLGAMAFITAVIAVETGLAEKTAFQGGCGYKLTEKDTNPAEHYDDIPDGCKMSQGVGMMIYITGFLTLFSIWELRQSSPDVDMTPLNL